MNVLTKLASDTAIYGLSSVIGRLLNYLLVPFYTSLLLPAEYGIIIEFYAYAAFLNVIYAYGMETAYFKFAALGRPLEVFKLTSNSLIFTSLVFSSIFAWLATPLTRLLGYPGHERYIYCLVTIVAIDTILLVPFARLRFTNQALRFAQLKCLQIGLCIALNFLLLYVLPGIYAGKFLNLFKPFISYLYDPRNHIEYVFLANIIANGCIFLLLGKPLISFRFQINWKEIRPILLYALPLLTMGLGGITNEILSRTLLKHILPVGFYPGQNNETVLGVFGACYKLSIFMPLATQAFRYALEPLFFIHAQAKHSPQLFSQVMQGYIAMACFIWFAISANLDVLGYLFLRNPVYRACIEVVPYLCFAYVWLGIYYNLSGWFKIANKTYYGSFITIIGAIITIVLNVLLVPYLGYWGSVWTTVCSALSMAVICYWQGKKHYPIPYQTGRGLCYVLGTLGLVVLVRNIQYAYWMYALISNIGFTLLFGLVIYVGIRKSFSRLF